MPGAQARPIGRIGRSLRTISFLVLATEASAFGSGAGWLNRAWQTEDGLPDTIVDAVVQGPDGCLWVGTSAGLVRFDGVRFEEIPLQGLPGISNAGVRALRVDREGAIWVGMDRGPVVCLEPGGTRVFTKHQGMPAMLPCAIAEDEAAGVWVGYASSGGLARLQNGEVARFSSREGLSGRGPWLLVNDVKGALWIANGQRVGRFTDGEFRVRAELKDPVAALAAARPGGLWVCAGRRLLRWAEEREPEERGELPAGVYAGKVQALLEDRAGAVWVGTATDGLWRWDGEEWVHLPTSHSEIRCLVEDREGDVWAGTGGGGLNRLRPRVLGMLGTGAGLPFESLRSVTEDADGGVWVTTASGSLLRQQTNGWVVESAGTNWPGGRATCVAADRQGAVWVGTEEAGLHRLQQGNISHWGQREGLAGNFVRSLLVGSDGDVWIATYNPSRLHRLHGETILTLKTPPGLHAVRAMAQDAAGTVWLGSWWGELLRVQGDEVVEDAATEAAQRAPIRCLLATPDGSLWIGYAGRGLGHLKGGRYSQITPAQGLGEEYISQMLEDGQGRMWFAGTRGFFRVNRTELLDLLAGRVKQVRSISYTAGEGVSSPQAICDFHPGAALGRDGKLWFATRKGLALTLTENLRENSKPPPVLMERMAVDGRTVALRDARWRLKQVGDGVADLRAPGIALRLPPGHRKVEFEFTAPSFPAPENVRFRYRLEGFDDDWTEVSAPRIAAYPRLPANEFRFRVLACNNDDVWNETGATLAFTVAPFLWQTWWFRLALAGVCAAIIAAFVRYVSFRRLHAMVRQLELETAVRRDRARIAQDLHDDLGSGLTEISFLGDFSESAEVEPSGLRARCDQIVARTQRMTRSLDEIVWAVNPANDTLKATASYLCSRAQEYLRAGDVRCRLEVEENLPDLLLPSDVRHSLLLALIEAVTNVMKHAQASDVWLRFAVKREKLVVRVEDNGTGFDTSITRDHHNGLRNMQQRCRQFGGECLIDSAPGKGTIVQFSLPLARFCLGKTSY